MMMDAREGVDKGTLFTIPRRVVSQCHQATVSAIEGVAARLSNIVFPTMQTCRVFVRAFAIYLLWGAGASVLALPFRNFYRMKTLLYLSSLPFLYEFYGLFSSFFVVAAVVTFKRYASFIYLFFFILNS